MERWLNVAGLWALLIIVSACGAGAAEPEPAGEARDFALFSTAFDYGEPIPELYTCDGEDSSPPLSWENPPEETAAFVLVVSDPDAPSGNWVHWVLYDIPGDAQFLTPALPPQEELPDGGVHGKNSWRRLGYGGPCPPQGSAHRYFFTLYALDAPLTLDPGATRDQLFEAMEGHLIAKTELMGTYERQ